MRRTGSFEHIQKPIAVEQFKTLYPEPVGDTTRSVPEDVWSKRLGERLKMLRVARQLDVAELGGRTGMGPERLVNLEAGVAELHFREALELARFFGCPVLLLSDDPGMGEGDQLFSWGDPAGILADAQGEVDPPPKQVPEACLRLVHSAR